MNLDALIRDVRNGESPAMQTRAAARLMTRLEAEPQRLPELFQYLPLEEWPRPRMILGITGAPGSGKSSLADAIIAESRIRVPEQRLGVIAVDPSSPFTGGAVLGDRVRMMRHATDPNVFIRSLATRGHLGGLSLGVKGVLRVMGLMGCDLVIIETVGVGQSEVEVARVADLVLVVLAPGHGDAVQLLKAGLLEVADVIAINKADREGAVQLHSTVLVSLGIGRPQVCLPEAPVSDEPQDSVPEVFLVSATDQTGIPELVTSLDKLADQRRRRWLAQVHEGAREEVRDAVLEEARRRVLEHLSADQLDQVVRGTISVDDLTRGAIESASQNHTPQKKINHPPTTRR